MRRGISYRSSSDVPTHIALHMGQGYVLTAWNRLFVFHYLTYSFHRPHHSHHIENIVQAVGRATFIGKGLLHQNGHEHVKALMTREDWKMVRVRRRDRQSS